MNVVLGVDAAWTSKNPSGVALAVESPEGWRLLAVASSYQDFISLAGLNLKRPDRYLPSAQDLLASARALSGTDVSLVAIDMPLSLKPIEGRRASDDAVSRQYSSRWCGTHTPSAIRPGPISDTLRGEFDGCGYPLQTTELSIPGVIEVYPHPALLELSKASHRLPYKAGKTGTYWPEITPLDRRVQLYQQWSNIVALLDVELSGVAAALPGLPMNARGADVKAYEDALDAVVCAWVAICALQGRASPFGDKDSAIWIPTPSAVS